MTNVSPGMGFSEPVVCVAPQHGMASIVATSVSPMFGFGTQDSALIGLFSGVGTQDNVLIGSLSGVGIKIASQTTGQSSMGYSLVISQ